MADYPAFDISKDSTVTKRGGLVTDTADDGTTRTRDIAAAVNYDFNLVHPYMTGSDRSTLQAHYDANKGSTFNWVSPWGDTYLVRWLDAPGEQPLQGGYWNLTAKLSGTKV